ncbi:MAG: 2-phospho-L-lactate transferase [Anaerolineales bacterium]|uniref:2-phospho-L-lactate transferase n=1 Tax=Candidatus Villigracilis vicinus TaxID=3140679 RepID=UPI00313493E9|nr:2-phospho-L-lactate transferase [Anaerolineales bacterium]MBK9781465.1 2-phospho-L-lactate transferase [Anaerolineales bacterium]
MKIVALAGGVGGAKLAQGLAQTLPPEDLTIIVNTGDDFEHLGLSISPDLDTVCYTLAGLANNETGWGRAGETWNTISNIEKLGGPAWFRLGDQDFATHLERTRRLKEGQSLSQITSEFCKAWGIQVTVLPMSDSPVRTMVDSDEGELAFQEYFVHRHCEPRVKGFRFDGVEAAKPAPGVSEALEAADAVIFCPSNPWVSIDPILGVVKEINKPVVAVSPIIGGKTVKGPAAKMYSELGIEPSALAVAKHHRSTLKGFVLDHLDASMEEQIRQLGLATLVTNTLMNLPTDRSRLANDVLNFIGSL